MAEGTPHPQIPGLYWKPNRDDPNYGEWVTSRPISETPTPWPILMIAIIVGAALWDDARKGGS